jgi:hypothetical protein
MGSSFAVGGNSGGNTTRIVAIGGADTATSSIAGAVAWGGTGSSSTPTQETAPGCAGSIGSENAMSGGTAGASAIGWGGAAGDVAPGFAGHGGNTEHNAATGTAYAGGGATQGFGGYTFGTGGTISGADTSVCATAAGSTTRFGNELECESLRLSHKDDDVCYHNIHVTDAVCDFRNDPAYPRMCRCPEGKFPKPLCIGMGTATPRCFAGTGGTGGNGASGATAGAAGQPEPLHAGALVAGGNSTCAASTQGWHCWGDMSEGLQTEALLAGASFVSIADRRWCALKNGQVVCSGGDAPQLQTPATSVATATTYDIYGSGYCEFSCAVAAGNAYCWGWYRGQSVGEPVAVDGLSGAVDMIAVGRQSCAVVAGGVKCWQNSVSAPIVDIEGLASGVTRIATGGQHSCAVVSGGLRCWGSNSYGQLGASGDGAKPVVVFGPGSDVWDVAIGSRHSCALIGGGVQCWGNNQYGQLGNDTETDSSVPVPVYGLESNVVALASGSDHNCALTTAGEVRCWGANFEGQLGNSFVRNSLVPEIVRIR